MPKAAPVVAVGEADPARITGARGISPFLIVCDHAGLRIPSALGTLGLTKPVLQSHRAWDVGIDGVARALGAALGAMVIGQRYSRLVIDCNRPPGAPDSIVTESDGVSIPGNLGLSSADIEARRDAVFAPYHAQIAAELDRRAELKRVAILVALHSFTPVFGSSKRRWHAGVLFDRDDRLGRALLHLLRLEPGLVVGCNQPYAATRQTDHTLMVHGEDRKLLCVEIEIRQDLIADGPSRSEWADRLARLLPMAVARL